MKYKITIADQTNKLTGTHYGEFPSFLEAYGFAEQLLKSKERVIGVVHYIPDPEPKIKKKNT